ncbi:hypothetical protein MMC17_000713 [Xylographa soralifera]|nr:hypothetical protein [Xylographa soralifera]
MSIGFTFGSLGDIVSICLIVKDLVEALDDSRGSSAEYQQLIRELRALEQILLQVDLLWRVCTSTVELNALRETSFRAAEQCRCSIESFLKKIKKYGPNLQESGSGSVVRDVFMKVRWHVTHADELTKFRAEINAHYSALNMLLLTGTMKLTKVNDDNLNNRLTKDDERSRASLLEHRALIGSVNKRIKENNRLITNGNTISQKIQDALRLDWIRQLGEDLKSFMKSIFSVNVATYKAVVAIQEGLPSRLERMLYQEPFILEDAIGRVAPVHMQFISS